MTTIQSNQRFELQYQHNGVWLDRHSGSTDFFGAQSPDDLLFDCVRLAINALLDMKHAGMDPDNLRIVEIDLTDAS
jgi:hypothetical protein